MKIIYFTSAIKSEDFLSLNKRWHSLLNPSNQNFHLNLIKALAINNNLEVVSIRPYSKKILKASALQNETLKDGNITWHYLKRKRKFDSLYSKTLLLKIRKTKETIILCDTMNVRALSVAKRYGRIRNIPVIGICTDSPNNITNIKTATAKTLLYKGSHLNGYICLTEGLNNLYNQKKKPFEIINGVIASFPLKKNNEYGKYILFAGSLLRKYGIYQLIDAVNLLTDEDIKLIVCGHTQEQDFLTKIYNNPKIKFLGSIEQEELANLEYNSLMCVNPRPLDDKIDSLSFPSKVIEYLNNAQLVLSTRNPLLERIFKTNIIWIDSLKPDEFSKTLKFALSKTKNEINVNKEKINEIISSYYSPEAINKKLNKFLLSFVIK